MAYKPAHTTKEKIEKINPSEFIESKMTGSIGIDMELFEDDYVQEHNAYNFDVESSMTDFAILLGGVPSNDNYLKNKNIFSRLRQNLKDRTANYYINSGNEDTCLCAGETIKIKKCNYADRTIGIRPTFCLNNILSYSEIRKIEEQLIRHKKLGPPIEIKYGEYPQYAVDIKLSNILEEEYQKNNLKKTGRTFTTDSRKPNDSTSPFKPKEHIEYEYNGKKYVRVIANCKGNTVPSSNGKELKDCCLLSNGMYAEDGQTVWVEVAPIEWTVNDFYVFRVRSKKILAAGIRYCGFNKEESELYEKKKKYYYDIDLKKTLDYEDGDAYTYLNDFFNYEMINAPVLDSVKEKYKNVTEDENKSKVYEIINQIAAHSQYYKDKDDIKQEINNMITDYNNSIDNDIVSNRNNSILLTTKNEMNYNTLLLKLNELQSKLESNYTIIKEYTDMLCVIDTIEKILNIKTNNNQTDQAYELENEDKTVLSTFIKIRNSVLPYFDEENKNIVINEFIPIINKYKNEINNYLNNLELKQNINKNRPKYKTVDEFDLYLRKDIQPILIKIGKLDLIKTIQNNMINAMNKNFEEGNDTILNNYYNLISQTIASIKSYIKEDEDFYSYYKEEIEQALILNLNTSMTKDEIYDQLQNAHHKLEEINLKIKEESKKKDSKLSLIK